VKCKFVTNKTPSSVLSRIKEILSNGPVVTYKKVAIAAYGLVVAAVLFSMIYLLGVSNDEQLDREAPLISDEELLAVLRVPDGAVSVPISNLEELLPPMASEPAWRSYAASWRGADKNRIAIVIDDLGLDQDMSRQLALIEGPLTLAFLPYAERLPEQAEMVRRGGHELLVHLPMEPKNDKADPGPNALLSTVDYAEFERRIDWNLTRFKGFVGINNHMGSSLTENPGLMVRLMVQLRKNGYLFLDSLTSPNSVGERAAAATGVPHIERDIFLDNERNITAILAQLYRTERIAKKRGYAIAIGHPYPETMKALQFWAAKLDQTKFSLVPISQLVAARTASEKLAESQVSKD